MLSGRLLSAPAIGRATIAAVVRAACLPLAVLVIAACETTAQQQDQARRAYVTELGASIRECTSRLRARPEFAPLYERMSVGRDGGGPSLAQRMDRARPTPEEAATIVRWHAAEAECRELTIGGIRRVFPEVAELMVARSAERDRVFLALANRDLRWNDAVDRLAQIAAAMRADLARFRSTYRASVARAHSQEVARRDAAIAGVLNALAAGASGVAEGYAATRQPAVLVPVQPIGPTTTRIQTNCRFIGPPINEMQCY